MAAASRAGVREAGSTQQTAPPAPAAPPTPRLPLSVCLNLSVPLSPSVPDSLSVSPYLCLSVCLSIWASALSASLCDSLRAPRPASSGRRPHTPGRPPAPETLSPGSTQGERSLPRKPRTSCLPRPRRWPGAQGAGCPCPGAPPQPLQPGPAWPFSTLRGSLLGVGWGAGLPLTLSGPLPAVGVRGRLCRWAVCRSPHM